MSREFGGHDFTRHCAGEYVRGDVPTNTIEAYFSIFKRGRKGVYQHSGKKHLHRYAAKVEFRYNNRVAHDLDDSQRANSVIQSIIGKRLTYKSSYGAQVA